MPTKQDNASVFPLTIEGPTDKIPAVPFPGRSPQQLTVLIPKWLYIRDRNGLYLTVRPGPTYATLTFRSGDPDLDCAFQAILSFTGYYHLRARTGKYITRYYDDWYSADDDESVPVYHSFAVVSAAGDKGYMRDSYANSLFISDELDAKGAPCAHNYINDSALMEISQAAIKNEISDVQYDLDGAKVREAAPLVALSTSVRNDSDGDVNQTLSYTYEKWSSGTWNNTFGIEIGVTASFEVGIPFVANAELEVEISASYEHEWGGETGVRQTISSSTQVTVPPKKKARATIIVRNAQIDVNFTYTTKILWANGETDVEEKKTGIYRNVDSWHVDVVLDNWEDI